MLLTNTTTNMNVSTLPFEVNKLSVTKCGNILLSDISLNITSNEITIILGPNGAGKSLFLRTAHGLETLSQGSIKWNTHTPSPRQPWRSYIFQKPVLLRRSVRANLEYVLSLHQIEKRNYTALINNALQHTGLMDLAERNARVLSGGEQQRLNIARAWVLQPKVILLDEPTAELDPNGTAAIERLIEEIAQQGTKVIMSTHDLGQARRLGKDILFFHQGKLIEHTPAEIFFTQANTEAAQNFIAGKLLNGVK